MKNIYWILAFFLLTFTGDRIGGWMLESLVENSQFRYSRMYRGEAKADMLLVGNSRGLSFYQPYMEEFTGKSTFNLSYSAMPMNLADALVRDYIDQYGAPEYMVVDVTLCDRLNPQLIAGFNCYTPFSKRLSELIYETSPKVQIGGQVSHLFRNNGEIFQRALYYYNRLDEDWLLNREISTRLKSDVASVEAPTVELVPEMVEALSRLVSDAQSMGVKVRLVVSPYYLPFAQKIQNLDEMVAQVEAATGLEVFDYSRAMDRDVEFGDYQHINVKGSKTFISLLKHDGVLP
ncbi:MAG: hypothetical protein KDC24_03145 [Saprospiraceae bacterium]|nr:hypothetical protein [Saprospiraceae bacterium]